MTQAESALDAIAVLVYQGKQEYIPLVLCVVGGYDPATLLPQEVLQVIEARNLEDSDTSP